MCNYCQDAFCGKVFIQVPDSFIGLADINNEDYLKLLNSFMRAYIAEKKRKLKGKDITINTLGEFEIKDKLIGDSSPSKEYKDEERKPTIQQKKS